ncbi:hypothetical protein [Sulfobacillus thermosulfidooxidans]|uniref:hypothetical protein n=1 Tax=Sulfobacillus thermosulfidooxidans TaxID=28034 RepID=UPI0006B54695|nr:hypothetical protein [Sulfobacillus thermosulfidooxidans]
MPVLDMFAVQPYMDLSDYANVSTFYHKMDLLLQKVSVFRQDDVPALVVFPEDLATFLVLADSLHLIEGTKTMSQAFSRIGQKLWPSLLGTMFRYQTLSLRQAFFLLNAPKVWRIWHTTMRELARQYHTYIVAGSALLPMNAYGEQSARFHPASKNIFNLSMTLNPLGEVIHITRKVNLVPTQEDVLDLSPGPLTEALEPVLIEGIPCATAICYDGFRIPHTNSEPQFTSLLPLMDQEGVRIIAQPSANPWWWTEPWPFNPQMTRQQQWTKEGAFSLLETFENISVIINPQMLFRALDIHFDGPSAIYGRVDGRAQILAQSSFVAPEPSSEDIVHFRWQD